MNDFYCAAGARIRELRDGKHHTREYLSELADISPKFLYEIETGQKGFSADTLYRISQALTVSCDYIMTGDTQNKYDSIIQDTLGMFNVEQIPKIAEVLSLINDLNVSH